MLMAKVLLRTSAAIEDCESHLSTSGAYGTAIESYLTQHILILLCADIQQDIYRIAEMRADITGDREIVNYVSSTGKRVLRSVQKNEIAGFVGLFGSDAKEALDSLVNESEVTIYNAAVKNRHDVAHKQGVQITFRELKEIVLVAERLLEAVAKSLGI